MTAILPLCVKVTLSLTEAAIQPWCLAGFRANRGKSQERKHQASLHVLHSGRIDYSMQLCLTN